jgi:site-specific DNA recombinase
MTRAAIYARYSSDHQREASIEDQLRICRDRLEREGWSLADVYSDAAITGATTLRPGYQKLLEDARSGAFEVIVAEALDRLSRDQEDIAGLYKQLTFAGVKLLTLAEGEINELHIGLKGTMNALYLKDLAQKTRRGQQGRVNAGKIPGGNSYGYSIVRNMLEDGSVSTGERKVDAVQAAIVRRIFQEYANGMPPRQIASRLNAEEIAGPRGGQWNASTINGSRQRRNGILNNELYVGQIVYNRQRFVKDPQTGKRISRPNPEHEWIRTEVPHLRIIDEETWEAVQSIKARYSSRRGNKRQSKKRLLSGLVKCGACGGSMTIINRERYYCSAKREKGTCNSKVGIAANELEERVLTGLKDILLGNEDLLQAFIDEYRAELTRLRKNRGAFQRQTQKDLTKINASIKRCISFITDGDGEPGHKEQAIEFHPNMAELYAKKVTELQSLLDDETNRLEAMETIRPMIERIEVSKGVERGIVEVVLVGALAEIMAFMQQNNTAASVRDGGRVLMVAGAGFEPATFRL